MIRSILTGFVLAALVVPTAAGADEGRTAVAPPGRCAEPRAAVDARTDDGFSVAGPISSLFDPVDVAASPLEAEPLWRQSPPVLRAVVRPGSCDRPGSGCGAALSTRPGVVEPPVGPGDPPPRDPR